jgi:hypothetical protein
MSVIDGVCAGNVGTGTITNAAKPSSVGQPSALGATFTIFNGGKGTGSVIVNGTTLTCPANPTVSNYGVICGSVTVPANASVVEFVAIPDSDQVEADIDSFPCSSGGSTVALWGITQNCTWAPTYPTLPDGSKQSLVSASFTIGFINKTSGTPLGD